MTPADLSDLMRQVDTALFIGAECIGLAFCLVWAVIVLRAVAEARRNH